MLGTQIKMVGLATLLAVGLTQTADAHGPTRKKVIETITINASPDKVWAVMGNFQDMSWLPGVKSTTGTGGNSIDPKNDDNEVAKRTITLDNGGTVLPVNDYSSTITVDSTDGGKTSTVGWRGAFYRGYMNNDPPPELTDEASMAAVRNLYKAGLGNLKKKAEAQG